jgi:putative ABC transport system substrate-binding protein
MSRRIHVCLLLTVFLLTSAEAQQPAKLPLIGVIGSGTAVDPRNKAGLDTLRDGLREFGYTEGKTISFVHRFAERDLARLPELADELVRLKIDIMVAIDSNAARAAKQSTPTVPIVILTGGDPVRNKLVTSLARPGANVTGLTTDSPRLADKRLGLLKESIPKLQRFAYLTSVGTAGSENTRNIVRDAQTTAKTLGVTFQAVEVKSANPDFEGVFQFMVKERIDGLVTEGPPIMSSNRKKILQLAEKHRLAAIHTCGDPMAANRQAVHPARDFFRVFRRNLDQTIDLPDVDLPDPGSPGANLMATYCAQCHNLPSPAMHSATDWPSVVRRMWLRMERLPVGLNVQVPDEGGRATMLTYLTTNALKVSGSNLPPGRGRAEFAQMCSRCHALPDPRVHSAQDWLAVYLRMERNMERMKVSAPSQAQAGEILTYLQNPVR